MKSQQQRAYPALIRRRKQNGSVLQWDLLSSREWRFGFWTSAILHRVACRMVGDHQCFGGIRCLHLQDRNLRQWIPPKCRQTPITTRYTVFWESTMDFILPQSIFLSPRICAMVAHVEGDDTQLPHPRLPCSIKSTYVHVKNIPERLTLQTSGASTWLKWSMSLNIAIKQQTSAWHWW
jgi:hypothetical protein